MTREDTQKAFLDIYDSSMTLDIICLKNTIESKFALISFVNVVRQKYTIKDRDNGEDITYESLDEFLDAGWVVD
jgi:hypothetical protein